MRPMWIIACTALLLAGCAGPAQTAYEPTQPLLDDTAPSKTIDAIDDAQDESGAEATVASEERPPLAGRVVDLDGAPIPHAEVYLEVVDLTEPVNNIQAYLDGKNASLLQTDAGGRFQYYIAAGEHTVAVRAAGFNPYHETVVVTSDGTDVVFTLSPRSQQTQVTAHRGASAYAPENTLEAIWKAALLGADRHEFDVVLSQDGVPYVLHDASLDRTTDCSGQAFQHTWDDVKDCDAGYPDKFGDAFAGTKLPTLEEALMLSRELGIFAVVEIKMDNDPTLQVMLESIAVADALGMGPDEAMFMSFGHHLVLQCATASDHICGQVLFFSEGAPTTSQETILANTGVQEIHAPSSSVNEGYVSAIQDKGYRLTVWTVDDPARMAELAAWGVDGITTNTPDVALGVLDAQLRA